MKREIKINYLFIVFFQRKLMKRASQPDEEEKTHDDGIVQAEPIIVDHAPKIDPKLLNTVLKVISLK
jgi:hypothetical protein